MYEEIEKVIDEDIRPYLRSHGGDMEVVSFSDKDGLVRFKLKGQCSGCPSANITTEELISSTLSEKLYYVKGAVLTQQVSDSLIEQARAILNKKNGK